MINRRMANYKDQQKKVTLVLNGKKMSFVASKEEIVRAFSKEMTKIFCDRYFTEKSCVLCKKKFIDKSKSQNAKFCQEKCLTKDYRNRYIETYNKKNGTSFTSYQLIRRLNEKKSV